MKKLGLFQLVGPIALFSVLAASEAVAWALERAPTSEWLWYLNLKWFGMFQESHYVIAASYGDHPQFVFVALPLLAAAGLGLVFRRSLLLAASSNLSFAYAVFVLLAWLRDKAPLQASLSQQYAAASDSEIAVLLALVALCLLSFVVSHIVYLRQTLASAA